MDEERIVPEADRLQAIATMTDSFIMEILC